MRLVESSNPEQVVRYNVRSHYAQRLVLVAALCRELHRHPDDPVSDRPQAALNVLSQWMVEAYDLPSGRGIDYKHGLDDPRLAKYASDMQRELELGTKVCEAYFMLFTADTQYDYDSDQASIRRWLTAYMAKFG